MAGTPHPYPKLLQPRGCAAVPNVSVNSHSSPLFTLPRSGLSQMSQLLAMLSLGSVTNFLYHTEKQSCPSPFHSSGAESMRLAYMSSLPRNLASLNQAADLTLLYTDHLFLLTGSCHPSNLIPNSRVHLLSYFSPPHTLTIPLPVYVSPAPIEPSTPSQGTHLGTHLSTLICGTFQGLSTKDINHLPFSLLSHLSLLGKCHTKLPALSITTKATLVCHRKLLSP